MTILQNALNCTFFFNPWTLTKKIGLGHVGLVKTKDVTHSEHKHALLKSTVIYIFIYVNGRTERESERGGRRADTEMAR